MSTTDLETGEVRGDLLPATIEQRAVPSFSLIEMAEALTVAEQLKRHIMRQGVDYGVIPGVKKPSLWKPGAERACQFYGLSHRMERVEIERDKDGGRVGVTYKCSIFKVLSDGREVPLGDCEGYAGNDESKWKTAPWNTILKMADKRAFIGAVLKATGMSDFFTQDVEDYADRVPAPASPTTPESPFLSVANVNRFTEKATEAGLAADDIEQLVSAATGNRTVLVAEVLKSEVAALRDAMTAATAKPDDTPSDPDDPGRPF